MNYETWTRTSTAYQAYRTASTRCDAAFTPTEKNEPTTPAPQLSEWTHPGTGETRYYINNVADLIDLDIDYYKSGNVSSATLAGASISNAEGRRIGFAVSRSKFFLVDGKLFSKWASDFNSCREIDEDEVVNAIKTALTEHGHLG